MKRTIDTTGEAVGAAPAPVHHKGCTEGCCHPECEEYLSQFSTAELEGMLAEAEGAGRMIWNVLAGDGDWKERLAKVFK